MGKLQARASLDPSFVVPSLLDALADDRDAGVRAIATTYLGIIHEDPDAAVARADEMLKDEDRRGPHRGGDSSGIRSVRPLTRPARASSRRGDKDENVAREAGLAS